MKPVVLSHSEFVGACEALSQRTGRPLGDVAAGLAASVTVQAPPPDLSRLDLRAYASAIARTMAELGCSASEAVALVRVEDFDGVR